MNNLKVIYYDFAKDKQLNKNELVVSFDHGEAKSFYGDDIWDFTYENSNNVSRHKVKIKFFIYNDYPKLKEAIKDILYKQLSNGVKTTTIEAKYTQIRVFFDYIISELNIFDINDLKIEHIRLYIKHVKDMNLSYSTCKNKLLILENLFYKYRKELKYKLNFHPFEGKVFKTLIHKSSNVKSINQTEIIPDETWKKIIATTINKINSYKENSEIEAIIHANWIAEYEKKKNGNHKDKTLDFRKLFNKPEFIKKSKGLQQYKSITEHKTYIGEIIIACGIIIQAFTGMRISELMSLKRNCCEKDEININGNKFIIKKLNGLTFKYERQVQNGQVGKKADWLCPDIVAEAIEVLENINTTAHYIFRDKGIEEYLFTFSSMKGTDKLTMYNVSEEYKEFLERNNIEINFKLTSHCFRRTLARFFARNLLNLPVESLKEQFKHFSKDITLYYMKEDLKNDGSFNELINDYVKNTDNKLLFEEVSNKFNNSILSANNLDEIRCFVGGKQVSLINEYMATLEKENKGISPLKSLTCEGTIILPGIHLDYWKEMLILYKDLIEMEPNSIWYQSD